MAKLALITDQHFGARNDSIHFHEYFERFYTQFFFPKLESLGITTIVELGDMFDRRKYINYDTLERCKKYWFEPIKNKGIELHCILGNHDVYFKNTNLVNSPNLLLNEYDFNVYQTPTVVDFDGAQIAMLPWINSENYHASMEFIESCTAPIMFGHLELQGFEMYRGAVNDHGLSHKTFSKFDMVMSGHFHHKSSKDNIHYLGSPYEMTWSDFDDPRGFHVFDTETREMEYIRNPYSMFHKVMYDDSDSEYDPLSMDLSHVKDCYIKVIIREKNNPYMFDRFMEVINDNEPAHVQVVEDNFHLDLVDDGDLVDEAEDTISIIKKYIGNMGLEDTKPIESLFNQLYHDALSIE